MKHAMCLDRLSKHYGDIDDPNAANGSGNVDVLPLAGERKNNEIVWWSAADTILKGGEHLKETTDFDFTPPKSQEDFRFKLLEEHRATEFVWHKNGRKHEIDYCVVKDLRDMKRIKIKAKAYIVCANATLTPQILWKSGMERQLPALGRYLCEQPMAFCQVVLSKDLVEEYGRHPTYKPMVEEHGKKLPIDPVPIPIGMPEPQVWIPTSAKRPWHCQIHRDAFNYGGLADEIDGRLVVDLRWFGFMTPSPSNRVKFERDIFDRFGMPQPTFEVTIGQEDAKLHHDMMSDMVKAAQALGGFLPGAEPRFTNPGLTLHVSGTVRMGESVETSVVDQESRVHGFSNLFLGGNGIHPSKNACNPTLTSVAYAIHSADAVHAVL
jgi:pyranose oxidase